METETEYKLMTNTVNRRYQSSDTAGFYCQTLSSQNKNPNPSPIREKFGLYLCGEPSEIRTPDNLIKSFKTQMEFRGIQCILSQRNRMVITFSTYWNKKSQLYQFKKIKTFYRINIEHE